MPRHPPAPPALPLPALPYPCPGSRTLNNDGRRAFAAAAAGPPNHNVAHSILHGSQVAVCGLQLGAAAHKHTETALR